MKWLSLTAAILFSFSAQVLLKVAGKSSLDGSKMRLVWLGISMAAYGLSFLSYYIALRKMPISLVGPVGTIGVTVLVFIVGVLLFKEEFNNWRLSGVLLGILAVILMLKGGK